MHYMLFIDVTLPLNLTEDDAVELRNRENAQAHRFIEDGTMLQIWRVAGRTANYSIWNTETPEALHDALQKMPMFPFMKVTVTPIIEHPVISSWRAERGALPSG